MLNGNSLHFISLLIYTALSSWCVRDAVVSFRKGDYRAFGIDTTLIFVVWVFIVKLVFL